MNALSPLAEACADVRAHQRTRLLERQKDAIDGAIEAARHSRDWMSRGRAVDAFAVIGKQIELLQALRRTM